MLSTSQMSGKGKAEYNCKRINAGLRRTVANGTKLGRKKITNPKMTAQIISLREADKSIRAIAAEVGVSTATIMRELKKAA
jgi:transposase-like protein